MKAPQMAEAAARPPAMKQTCEAPIQKNYSLLTIGDST